MINRCNNNYRTPHLFQLSLFLLRGFCVGWAGLNPPWSRSLRIVLVRYLLVATVLVRVSHTWNTITVVVVTFGKLFLNVFICCLVSLDMSLEFHLRVDLSGLSTRFLHCINNIIRPLSDKMNYVLVQLAEWERKGGGLKGKWKRDHRDRESSDCKEALWDKKRTPSSRPIFFKSQRPKCRVVPFSQLE